MNLNSLIASSTDPKKVSLTIKSIAAFVVLFGLDSVIVNQAADQLTNLIAGIGMTISAASALYGLARKAYLGRWSA